MKLGIFAKTFPGSEPYGVLREAQTAGFQAVQYNMACSGLGSLPIEISDAHARAVANAAARSEIEIAALSATYNMIDPDRAKRVAGRKSFAAIAQAARMIGTRLLTVCSGSCDPVDQWRHHPGNESTSAWNEMCDEFAFLLEIAETHDVVIGVEPELANVINSAARARLLLDTFGSHRIRIVLDPANLFEIETPDRRREIVSEAVSILGDSIVLAHAKDRFADGGFATAGTGVIDWPHYIGALKSRGFSGALVTHGLSAVEAPAVSTFLERQLAALAP